MQSPALQRQAAAALQQAQQRGSKQRYVAVAAPPRSAWAAGPDAAVLLERQAGAPDMLQGFCAALLLAWGASLQRGAHGAWPPSAAAALADVDAWLAGPAKGSGGSSYSAFVAALRRAGWAVDRLALQAGQARLAWGAELRAE